MAVSGFLGSRAEGLAPAAQLAVFGPFAPGRRQGVDLPIVDGIEAILGMMADPRVDIGQASHSTGDTSRLGGRTRHPALGDRDAGRRAVNRMRLSDRRRADTRAFEQYGRASCRERGCK